MRALSIGSVALVAFVSAARPAAQDPAPPAAGQPQQGGRGAAGRGRGPNYEQHRRPLADPAVLARGKGFYDSNCAACHGIDLRGGQQGGPNLLRSQLVLSDKAGESIGPVIRTGRPNPPAGAPPMPPFPLATDDINAISEYIHSVMARAGTQGRPPEGEFVPPEKILVGNAAAGQTYFASRCSSCHSVTGDLKGLASGVADARELQNRWVSGGRGGGRGRGGGDAEAARRPVIVTVTPSSGPAMQGRLVRIDDFVVTLVTDDGTRRTFTRTEKEPKIDIRDPSQAHRALVPSLADKDMHDVTAYLWSLRQ